MRKFVMCGTMRSIKFQIENMKEKNPDQHQWERHNYHFFFYRRISNTRTQNIRNTLTHTIKQMEYIYMPLIQAFLRRHDGLLEQVMSAKKRHSYRKKIKRDRRSWVLQINTDTHAYIYMLYTVIVLPCGCQDRVLRLNDNTPLISWIFLIFVFFFSMKDISSGDC